MGERQDASGDSTLSVLAALAANVAVGLVKLAAGLFGGSAAMLSEAAHSAGDSSTELLLLVALRRSDRPADAEHPFGYGKERYFWSLLGAGAIFLSGAAFSLFEGIHTIVSGGAESGIVWVSYPALAIAFVFEATSLRVAIRQLRAHIRRRHQTLRQYVANPEDPTVNSVTWKIRPPSSASAWPRWGSGCTSSPATGYGTASPRSSSAPCCWWWRSCWPAPARRC